MSILLPAPTITSTASIYGDTPAFQIKHNISVDLSTAGLSLVLKVLTLADTYVGEFYPNTWSRTVSPNQNTIVTFNAAASNFRIGQYYKMAIAYTVDNENQTFSDYKFIKYTSDFYLGISNLSTSAAYQIQRNYTGYMNFVTSQTSTNTQYKRLDKLGGKTEVVQVNSNSYLIHANCDKIIFQGLNLWDGLTERGYLKTDGTIYYDGTNRTTSYIPVDSSSTYHITAPTACYGGKYVEYDSSLNFISYSASGAAQTFTTGTSAKYIRITFNNGATADLSGVCIYKGGSTGSYAPYKRVTTEIPKAVQELTGYGWGAGEKYNEVDFVNKKFVKRVGSINLSNLDYQYSSATLLFSSTTSIEDAANPTGRMTNLISIKYAAAASTGTPSDKTAYLSGKTLYITDSGYSTAEAFKNALNNTILYYELETPIESTISNLNEDILFDNESGSTITFYNSHNIGIAEMTGILNTLTAIDPWDTRDTTEKVNYYKYKLYNSSNSILQEPDWTIYTSNGNEYYNGYYANFKVDYEFQANTTYKLSFLVKTNTGLVLESDKFLLTYTESSPGGLSVTLNAENADENGYNTVTVTYTATSSAETYEIVRQDNISAYWKPIYTFLTTTGTFVFKDYAIENGISYKYGVRKIESDSTTTTTIYGLSAQTSYVTSTFEDIFLMDKERVLRLKYNPSISGYKSTKLRTKVETIGSKFPFVLSNGYVDYKDFQISSLLSFESDIDLQFLTSAEATKYGFIDSENIMAHSSDASAATYRLERIYRELVNTWLNNGKPKLFKSSSEGNYIIAISDVSLDPTAELNRMLYTVTISCSEIEEYNYQNLLDNDLIDGGAES